jgi:hypothetical protein
MSRMFGEDAVEMGTRIVMFALTPRVRPSENRDYYDLIQAYKSLPEVREAAKLIAHAMRVQLCDDAFFLDSTGPIAILSPGSLFIPKLADFRGGMKVNERLGYGLLFFVVAAYVFPSADALAEDTVALGHKISRASRLIPASASISRFKRIRTLMRRRFEDLSTCCTFGRPVRKATRRISPTWCATFWSTTTIPAFSSGTLHPTTK